MNLMGQIIFGSLLLFILFGGTAGITYLVVDEIKRENARDRREQEYREECHRLRMLQLAEDGLPETPRELVRSAA